MFKSVFSRLFWNKIIIIFIALASFTLSLVVLFNDYVCDRQYESDLKMAKNIQFLTIELQIENHDPRNAYVYKSMVNQYSDLVDAEITVVDSLGNVFYSTDEVKKVPELFNRKVFFDKIVREQSDFDGYYKKDVFVVGVPMKYEGKIVGGVYFNTNIPNMQGRIKEYSFMFLLASIISCLIGIIVSYIQSRRITMPIKEINKGVLEIASGNFSKRINVTKDEVGQLASSFNYMASSLERLEDMRSGFVSDVSHELRTPMTSISGFVGGILDGTIPEEKAKEYLQIVYDESVRLTKLTNDLLEMTKMQSSEYKLDISEFDINELVRICIIQLENKIESKNLELDVIFNKDKQNVLADKDAIKRVIINILDNAIKFSYENTKIVIKVYTQGKKVNVSIGNFGAGIGEKDKESIFDRFYKTDKSRSEDKKGAGLGLSLAKNIMNLHKQSIWVESDYAKEGSNVKFTNFTFTLEEK